MEIKKVVYSICLGIFHLFANYMYVWKNILSLAFKTKCMQVCCPLWRKKKKKDTEKTVQTT